MKKLVMGIFALVLCCSSFARFENNFKNRMNKESIGNDVDDYLKNYYGKNYTLGKSVETMINEETVTVSEVIVESSEAVNGYIVVRNNDSKFLNFMDVDRTNLIITAVDIVGNETVKLKKLDNAENVNLDFLSGLNNSGSSNSFGRFWGWSCGKTYSIEVGSCYRTCTYYVLYQAWTPSTDAFSCDALPGRHPKLD